MLLSIFNLVLLSFSSLAKIQTIAPSDFQVGREWVWAYSENSNGNWNSPYLFEKYSVTAIDGDIVTMEMSSSAELPVTSPAHHKIRADVKGCLSALNSFGNPKPWTVQFFTTSFGSGWQVVSYQHPHLVFTEKFNCVSEVNDPLIKFENVTFSSESLNIVQISNPESTDPLSWYVNNSPSLGGIAYRKYFDSHYKFELVQWK